MYTDSWNIENRRSFEPTTIMSSTQTSGHPNSLPPLHQVAYPPLNLLNDLYAYSDHGGIKAIPEFHLHRDVPRGPVGLARHGSPSFRSPHRVSPSSSSAISDTGSMAPTFSFLDSDVSAPRFSYYPDLFLTGDIMTVPTSLGDHGEGSYDAQTYMFPSHLGSGRGGGSNSLSSNSSPHVGEPRPSPYLPPVSSLTSSRGSSFDMDSSERPSAPLPLLYNSHPQPSSSSHGYASHYEHDALRSQQTTPDYGHSRYSAPSPYQSSSPVNGYAQPHSHYYAHSGPYPAPHPPRTQTPTSTSSSSSYAAGRHHQQGAVAADPRSPFSTPSGHPGELSMDHFEQGRPGKRRRGNLPKQVTDLLRSWLNDHLHHPYPTEDEKQMLMAQTGLTIHQISNWFINARRRRIPAITNPESRSSGPRRTTN